MFTAVLFAYKNKSVGDKLTPTENLSLILEKWKIYDKNQEICLIFEKSKEIDDFLKKKNGETVYNGLTIYYTAHSFASNAIGLATLLVSWL